MTPLVFWSIAWGIGIWLGERLAAPLTAWAGGAALALLAAILVRSSKSRPLFIYAVALALGGARLILAEPDLGADALAAYNGAREVQLEGVVADEADVRGSFVFYKLDAKSLALRDSETAVTVHGAARLRGPRYPVYAYGDRLRVTGDLESPPVLETFDYRDYLARRGIHSQVPFGEIERLSSGDGSGWKRAMLGLKRQAQETIGRALPEPEASLLTGILLGNEGGIPEEVDAAFETTGASHVIAISGFNITIVVGLILTAVGRVLPDRRWGAAVAILGISAYTLLVGADAAVVRAAIMGAVTLFGLFVGRTGLALNTLAFAGFAMTAFSPFTLWDVGFQLSVAATLGLILYAAPLERAVGRLLTRRFSEERATTIVGWISEALLLTLAAQVWTTPLILWRFGRFSAVSLLANALILPVQPLVMVLGGAATLAGLLFEPLGRVLGWAAYLPLTWTIRVVEATARLPYASVPFQLSDGGLVAVYALVGAATLMALMKPERRRALWEALRPSVPLTAGLGGMTALALVAWVVVLQLPDDRLRITFLDVGQGDAILIETPGGAQILVDGGPQGDTLLAELGRQIPFWDRSLDLVVSTHSDSDHLTGLVAALERYDVAAVLVGPETDPTDGDTGVSASWQAALAAEGALSIPGKAGARLALSDGVALEVLHPSATWDASAAKSNDNSVVLRLTYRDVAVLLPGDVEAEVERLLAGSGAGLSSTVLKLPHHGSRTSSSRPFLDAVQPQVAVISVGADNEFGHPAGEVLGRLGETLLYRTDRNGTVSITSDGHRLWIETER